MLFEYLQIVVRYYDESKQKYKKIKVNTANKTKYDEVWRPFLQAFVKHLDEKDWFDSAYIRRIQRTCEHSSPIAFGWYRFCKAVGNVFRRRIHSGLLLIVSSYSYLVFEVLQIISDLLQSR